MRQGNGRSLERFPTRYQYPTSIPISSCTIEMLSRAPHYVYYFGASDRWSYVIKQFCEVVARSTTTLASSCVPGYASGERQTRMVKEHEDGSPLGLVHDSHPCKCMPHPCPPLAIVGMLDNTVQRH